ncbi:MAG: FkbM family methyltransferase [Ruminococcaceae bacterium]|nr:FkbM family methyltransferase [Oscillospiraceae bacterium]
MRDVFDIVKEHNGQKFIYGTGDGADKLIDYLESINVNIDGICVSDAFFREKIFRGMKIQPLSKVISQNDNALFMMAFGVKETDEIFSLSKRMNLIYPEMPVFGKIPFTKEALSFDMEKIKNAYSLLADEESKKVFENILRFRLSGNISFLKECESSIENGYKLLLRGNIKETVFDCGAYTGDTAEDFEKYSGGFDDFYASEPCPKSFEKLKTKYGNFNLYNCAVGKENGETDFVFSRGRGSVTLGTDTKKAGKIKKVEVRTVDDILQGKYCSVIKYDVEGAEADALLGSLETIKLHHPKLLVAAYHRAEDIYALPLLINSMSKDYKIYLRHHPCLPSWETNVYAI